MARSDFGFLIGSALATNYLTDSKFVRGGYIAVETTAERDALPVDTGNGGVIIDGSQCYVKSEDKCYIYKNNAWVLFEQGKVDDVQVNGTSIVSNKIANLTGENLPAHTLSKVSDVTATAAELNVLDGITATTQELNYTDGVTSNIQTLLDSKQATIDSSHKLSSDLVDDTDKTNKFVTQADKDNWDSKTSINDSSTTSTTETWSVNKTNTTKQNKVTIGTTAPESPDYGDDWLDTTESGYVDWGNIGGTLSNLSDLSTALSSKVAFSDLASNSNYEVTKFDSDFGITDAYNYASRLTQNKGKPCIVVPEDSNIDDKSGYKAVTVSKIDRAVRAGLVSNSEITESDKPTICNTIGAQTSSDNNLNTTSKTVVGAINENKDSIDNLKAIGRFLSVWNCVTGLPTTNPSVSPYTYKTGDYFLVGTVGTTNYMPNGSSYTIGVASTTIDTNEVAVSDYYVYDGTTWRLLKNTQKALSFANITGSPSDNTALNDALNGKVGFTDYPTSSKAGVIAQNGFGTTVDNIGRVKGKVISYSDYPNSSNYDIISKGTLENIKNDLVSRTPTHQLAAQANQAIGLENYSTLVTILNGATATAYNVGQSIYIRTLDVPDVWIYSVESSSVQYTYTTDTAIVNALAIGPLQIGYYKISKLETLKVDLTNYVQKTDYATDSVGGVIKFHTNYGFNMFQGYLIGSGCSYSDYLERGGYTNIAKDTLENVLDNETIRIDKSDPLTEAQKTQAYSNMGAVDTQGIPITTSITSSSTDEQIPSAKAVKDGLNGKLSTSSLASYYGFMLVDNNLLINILDYNGYTTASNYRCISKGTLENALTGKNLNDISNETWTFTNSDGTTITKTVKVGS